MLINVYRDFNLIEEDVMSDIEIGLDIFACLHCGRIYHRHGLRETFCENCDRILEVKKINVDMVNNPPHYKDESGIEVGSVWVDKANDKNIATVTRLMPENKALQYKTSIGWTTSGVAWFLEDFKPMYVEQDFEELKA